MAKLKIPSSQVWLDAVMADFDAFLLDHAGCERKASAMALSLISHYPDRVVLVQEMMVLAREELEHFHQMLWLTQARGLVLLPAEKDLYVQTLRSETRRGSDAYFLDRLLVAGIIEMRGCERFGLVAEALDPGPLQLFYHEIARTESRHGGLFYRLARRYFDATEASQRQEQLLEREAQIIESLPVRPVVH
ncbi:MAG: tRNA-(ms[2]io[6]A)-hydroxylase [Myxococcota bacterium]|nr:tRNA-(ms[2]io[6]A)-hydroxylase [Myxococcota bacterium]